MQDRTVHRVLITGAAGASGRLLAGYLLANEAVDVHGLVRRKGRVDLPGVVLHEGDLLDTASLVRVLRDSRLDVIFHAAANPDKGFDAPSAVLMNNVVGTANLFEAVHVANYGEGSRPLPVVVMVSSSEVYGDVQPGDVPIKEDCPFRPMSPYAVSKVACDHMARVYFKAYGLPVITTRAFTYLNPLRPDLFASSFAKQIALIEAGKGNMIRHGNLDSVRTLMDARDMCRAYWLAATRCRLGEAYNIGGNVSMMVGEVLERLMGMAKWPPGGLSHKIVDQALLRPADVTMQIPDTSKFRNETGWEPEIDVDASLRGLLDYYRQEAMSK